jgi:hypothetical protein
MQNLEALRVDFERRTNRSLAMPIAGAMIWSTVSVLGALLPPRMGMFALVALTGAIFPLAILIANARREELLSNDNPLARLMGACVLMVNLLWVVHITLLLRAPRFVPLSIGVGLGIHWVVYSWIIRHPLGYVHALARAILVVSAWWLFPANAATSCALAVVACYGLSIYQMATRNVPSTVISEPAMPG